MHPAKAALNEILGDFEIPSNIRTALEKRVISSHKEIRASRDEIKALSDEKETLAQRHTTTQSEVARLSAANDSLAQQLRGKCSNIMLLEEKVGMLKADLIEQRTRGYDVAMIRDFLEQLRLDITLSFYENKHPGCSPRSDLMAQVRKYVRRYGQHGSFTPIRIGRSNDKHRTEAADKYRGELDCLTRLWERLDFALEAASRPSHVYVICKENSDKEGWHTLADFRNMVRNPYLERRMQIVRSFLPDYTITS